MITLRGWELRLRRVVAPLDGAPSRVAWHAARLDLVLRVTVGVPVGRPLPDVAGHVVEVEAVGREGADRRCRAVALLGAPEIAVPVVRQPRAGELGLVTPDVGRAVEPAARRAPTRPRWEGPARPRRRRPRRPRRRRGPPGGPRGPRWSCRARRAAATMRRGPRPPLAHVPQVHRPGGPGEHERSRDQVLGRGAGKSAGSSGRSATVTCRWRPRTRVRVRGLMLVDREPVHADPVRGRLLR